MIRYFGLLVVIAIVVVAGYVIFIRSAGQSTAQNNKPSINPNSPKAIGTGSKAILQLDRILHEPMLISSDEWKDESKQLVDEWYGK